MTSGLHTLDDRLLHFAGGLDQLRLTPSRRSVEAVLGEMQVLFDLIKKTDVELVTLGLERSGFPFVVAQAELERHTRQYGRLLRRLVLASKAFLSEDELKEAERLAFMAEHAPHWNLEDLEAIRRCRHEREQRKRATRV